MPQGGGRNWDQDLRYWLGVVEAEGDSSGSSMARTTGAITCALVEWIERTGVDPGIHPPETLPPDALTHCMDWYGKSGVTITCEETV